MRKIVEKSLEAALIKASMELGCSVADLEYEVVQNPSGGFLGLGKKEAIIIVDDKKQRWAKTAHSQSLKIKEVSHKEPKQVKQDVKIPPKATDNPAFETYTEDIWGEENRACESQNQDDEANVAQIRTEIESLFALLPFDIDKFDVRLEPDKTLFVYIDGRDCALLIGEKGYRYKALSYLLFNWVNSKYGYSLRLEIAEFLKNQEEMIDVYLKDIVRLIKLNGRAQTKTLDGILVYIALNKLREMSPNKYVSVRQNEADEKYIIINDFRR